MEDLVVEYEIINREQATLSGLEHFYTGKLCKWGHKSRRYTRTEGFKITGLCETCCELRKDGKMIGETFDNIMSNWDNTSEVEGACRLPCFSGTSNIGYKVVGFTLIDESWYNTCSKLLWIKSEHYVKCSLSAANVSRLGKLIPKQDKIWYILLHRFILGLGNEVIDTVGDHISGNKLDNRLCNLRMASIKDNSNNSKISKNNTSGYVGVFLDTTKGFNSKRYRAKVVRCGTTKAKFFNSYEEAAAGYDNILRKFYPSEFNRYNFPLEGELGVH